MEALARLTEYEPNTPMVFLGILPWYGIFVMAGFLVAVSLSYIEWNKMGWRTYDFMLLTTFTGVVALYGAKFWYMLFDPVNAFAGIDNLLTLITVILIPSFGRSIMGTIVFTPIGIWMWKKYFGPEYETLKLIDVVMPYMLIAIAIGRWGNFANHQIYGGVVADGSLNWLPDWISNNMYINDGVVTAYRQPLFLYESITDMTLFVIVWLAFKTNNYFKDGVACFASIGAYGLARTIFEPLRDPSFVMHWGPIPTSLVFGILFLVVGVVVSIYLQVFRKD